MNFDLDIKNYKNKELMEIDIILNCIRCHDPMEKELNVKKNGYYNAC